MKVITNRNFYDLKDDCYRKVGDVFEVSKARYDELNELVAGFVEEIEEKAPAKAVAKKEEKKTSTK